MELVPSVLLVAASPETLEPVAVELAVTGFRSQTVTTGEEALARAAGRSYDVVIISTELPGADSPSLVRQMKLLQPGLACVVVAGQPSREAALYALAAGALAYLSGPLNAQALAALVKERRRHTLSATEDALTVRVEDRDGSPLLLLTGDLDIVTVPQLQRLIDELLRAGHDRLLVDAEGLGFCDSTGLRVLLGARRRLVDREGELRLLGTSPILQRLLDLSGLDDRLGPIQPLPV